MLISNASNANREPKGAMTESHLHFVCAIESHKDRCSSTNIDPSNFKSNHINYNKYVSQPDKHTQNVRFMLMSSSNLSTREIIRTNRLRWQNHLDCTIRTKIAHNIIHSKIWMRIFNRCSFTWMKSIRRKFYRTHTHIHTFVGVMSMI